MEQFAKETSDKYTELLENQNNRQKSKNAESNKDNQQLKAVILPKKNSQTSNKFSQIQPSFPQKIAKQQEIIKKHESTICGLQQQLSCFDSPQKQLNVSGLYAIAGSPKTPKKQLLGSPFPGKENRSPAVYSPRTANALRPRNN